MLQKSQCDVNLFMKFKWRGEIAD